MKLKRLTALCLCVLLLLAVIVPASAAQTRYVNRDYLETQARAAYNEQNLGAAYTPTATTWKVWSPSANNVQLNLYKTGSDDEAGAKSLGVHSMNKNASTGVWSLTLSGDYKNVYYTYTVQTNGVNRETRDIYAKASGVNGRRSMVVDLDSTDPIGWASDKHVLNAESTDAVIWELHIRDFSISTTSGVSEGHRGKYLAFTEGETTLNGTPGDVSTCLNYLKEMGVNTVHLLPVYDFGSVDETVNNPWITTSMAQALSEGSDPEYYRPERNWGYDPVNYNVPEGSYSTDPYHGEARIKEFKQMIQALHKAGISVVMDVVYNHTYDLDDPKWGRVLINNAFNDTVPGYYYRMKTSTDWYNGSGCGNVTASDKLMFRKYMKESVAYWAEEYHIDGFRFDLMACHDVTTMNEVRATLDSLYTDGSGKQILMYGEPWAGGETGIADGCTVDNAKLYGLNERVAMFCDWMRDSIKGNPDGDSKGWIQGDGEKVEAIRGGITADDGRLTARSQTVTYADAHDNLILWDKLVKSNGSGSWTTYEGSAATIFLKQLRLAETILMVSQGMQFQVAGTEFARSKYGCHNSYKAGDNINAIDWGTRKTNAACADFYKGLIQIRKNFSPITDPLKKYKERDDNWLFNYSDKSVIAFWIDNTTAGEWSKLVVLLNNSEYTKSINLPAGNWSVLSDGVKAGVISLGTCTGSYSVPPYGSAILKLKADPNTCQHTATVTETIPATASAPGKVNTYCKFCDKLLSSEQTHMHVAGDPVVENQTAPTCTQPGGYDTVTYCTICHEVIESVHTTIPATGHNYVGGFCTNCGAQDPNYNPDADHCDVCGQFTDVVRTSWYHSAVDFVIMNGLMNGTSKTTFEPNTTMSRAMLVQVLYNLVGTPAVSGTNPFSDVKAGQWYYKAVLWASQNGIVSGYENGKFGVNDPVTREQIASILYRFADHFGRDVSAQADLSKFVDGSTVSAWAQAAMAWAVSVGFISGKENGGVIRLDPQGKGTRAEVASMLMRYCKLVLVVS